MRLRPSNSLTTPAKLAPPSFTKATNSSKFLSTCPHPVMAAPSSSGPPSGRRQPWNADVRKMRFAYHKTSKHLHYFRMPSQVSQRSHFSRSRRCRCPVQGELRPHPGQGDAPDGPDRRGAANVGLKVAQANSGEHQVLALTEEILS